MSDRKPWYSEAFEAEYLDVYSHRTDESAAREVAWIQSVWHLDPGARILDLACGNGRHAAAWDGLGCEVVGVDLSRSLLERARDRRLPRARFVCADMTAVPVAPGFDAVTSFFTSFGYFETEEHDARVLREIARLLVPQGRFLIDFLNADHVRATLQPTSHDVRDGVEILQQRSITPDGKRVEKTIDLTRDGVTRRTSESVRLYDRADLERLLGAAEIAVEGTWGGLDGREWTTDAPRTVMTGLLR